MPVISTDGEHLYLLIYDLRKSLLSPRTPPGGTNTTAYHWCSSITVVICLHWTYARAGITATTMTIWWSTTSVECNASKLKYFNNSSISNNAQHVVTDQNTSIYFLCSIRVSFNIDVMNEHNSFCFWNHCFHTHWDVRILILSRLYAPASIDVASNLGWNLSIQRESSAQTVSWRL